MPSNTPTRRPDRPTTRRRLLRTAGAALAAAHAGCVGSVTNASDAQSTPACANPTQPFPGEWPMPGYDRRNTSFNPETAGPTRNVGVRWTDGGHGFVRAAPAVADGTVFLHAHPNRLRAFDAEAETEQWTVELGESVDSDATVSYPPALSAPTVVDDTVYVGGGPVVLDDEGDRERSHVALHAVDRDGGEVRWTFPTDEPIHTAPVVVGDRALFATKTGTVYAVVTDDPSVAWTFSVEGNPGPVVSTPAVDDCRLYLATFGAGLYAVDAETGELDWHAPEIRSRAAPAVTNGRVYAATNDGRLVAVNPADGAVEWEYATGGPIATAGPAVADGVAFVGNAAGDPGTEEPRAHAVDAETGDARWTAKTREYVKSAPAVADGVAYVGAGPRVLGLGAKTGEQLWSQEIRGWASAPLAVADGTVFAATGKGQLYAIGETDSG